ncbi:MAG TPA: serine/threonine-protein kinase [Streptosporangiaceae bacterium]|nr:serine/threonine-protein kinase [Streptosporangiaceae bacterium]
MSGDIRPAIGDFPAGTRIANYQIDQLIGRGGMAVVYRATDVRLDRIVALKILSQELGRNDAFRQRFIRESRAGAAVDHPHVIPVFEAGDADGVLFIAMRYVAGQDVRALIEREGKLSAARTVEIVTQVASALDAAHANGLVHRDVKPANMLLASVSDGSAGDHVYLSDFGLSKQSLSSPSLTRTGQFLGTLDYMSPEQISGRAVDGKTDLYALGCAAFEMLTGQPPFKRDANLAVMWAQVSAEPPSIRQWRPELSPAVDHVIGTALAKAPQDRQNTCTGFALALRTACGVGAGGGAPPLPPPTELAHAAGAAEPTVSKAVAQASDHQAGLAATGPAPVADRSYQPEQPGYAMDPTRAGATNYATGGPQYGGPQYGGPYTVSGPPAGYSFPPQQPPRRGKALPILVGCLVVVALAAAAVLVLHLRNSASPTAVSHSSHTASVQPSSPTGTGSTTPSTTASQATQARTGSSGPGAAVKAFYRAVNNHNYARAWQLNTAAHSLSSYAAFRQGFAQTARDTVTITSVSGDIVSIQLASAQTDGSTKYFQGNYTVQNGIIVAASIQQVG